MLYLLPPALGTLFLILIEIFYMHRKNSPWYYFRFYAAMTAISAILFWSNLEASQISYENMAGYESMAFSPKARGIESLEAAFNLSFDQYREYEDLAEFHKLKGQKCVRDANDLCLFIPDVDDRQVAIELFRVGIAASIGKLSYVATASAILISLADYGIYVYKQYNDMETLLKKAEYHFEMMDFHNGLLEQSERKIY